tara:strand:+ start:660 stop:1970 length:1311 start_codon:yes stop_codon:yes gene_type:complete
MSIVYALATPPAKSAICVFRVSGDGCLDLFNNFVTSLPEKERFFYTKNFSFNGVLIDRVGMVFFKGPKSYTGEDSVEIYAHGGLAVIKEIIKAFKGVGIDEAGPGEFTKRAFLNDKLSLNEAESVLDLINASTKNEAFLSASALSGSLSSELNNFSDQINNIRLRVEGEIDFNDEDEVFLDETLKESFGRLIEDFESFISKCHYKSNESVSKKVVFVGPVNSGKSSLFNRLLGFERAIVSDRPGTTRDLIDSELFYNDLSFSLYDTAGLRDTDDVIEEAGIEKSKEEIKNSDLVVGVFDQVSKNKLGVFKKLVGDRPFIGVFNKTDLGGDSVEGFDCSVSAKTGDGIGELKKMISKYFEVNVKNDFIYMVKERHIDLFSLCLNHLKSGFNKLENDELFEIVAEDLKISRGSLDSILGKKSSDDLLGDIFNNFCIGK